MKKILVKKILVKEILMKNLNITKNYLTIEKLLFST